MLETEQVTPGLEGAITYYVAEGMNADYEGEHETLYDDLNLQGEENIYGMSNDKGGCSSSNISLSSQRSDPDICLSVEMLDAANCFLSSCTGELSAKFKAACTKEVDQRSRLVKKKQQEDLTKDNGLADLVKLVKSIRNTIARFKIRGWEML
jgi:hypothetical protein